MLNRQSAQVAVTVIGLLLGGLTGEVSAAQPVTFVSTSGSDASVCDRANPCRTIGKAILEAYSGGAVVILGEGPYDEEVNVFRSVTIEAESVATIRSNAPFHITGNVVVRLLNLRIMSTFSQGDFGTVGISVEGSGYLLLDNVYVNNKISGEAVCIKIAPEGEQVVDIRGSTVFNCGVGGSFAGGGVVFDGAQKKFVTITDSLISSTSRGIVVKGTGAVQLSLNNMTISRAISDGILFSPTAGASKLTIKDSQIVNNAGGGVVLAPTGSAKVNATVIGTAADNNDVGIWAKPAGSATATVAISDTSTSGNRGGVYASGNSVVGIMRGNISGNSSYGLGAAAPAVVRVGSSMINSNPVGLSGPIGSYGNNQMAGNTVTGYSTPVAPASVP